MRRRRGTLSLPTGMSLAYSGELEHLLLNSPAFRRFVWELWRDAGMYVPTYSLGSPSSASDHAYREGRRTLGLEVLHKLKAVRGDVLHLIDAESELLKVEQSPQRPPTLDEEMSQDEDEPELPYAP